MDHADVAIIGGGLVGLLTARELALSGAAVTVLDRGQPGRESSWAGGGILSPLYPWHYPDPVSELARWSQEIYPHLCDTLSGTGVDPQWTRSGMLLLDGDAAAGEAWAGRYGSRLEVLTAREAAGVEPALRGRFEDGACRLPDVAQVRNPRLLEALRRDLAARGVRLHGHRPVTRLRREGGRVTGVETDAGPVEAGSVVLAAGAWSAGLAAGLPVPLPVRPVRGQMLLFRAPPGMLGHIVLDGGRYLIPRRDGRILAGSTMEEVGFDTGTTSPARTAIMRFARQRLPELAHCPIEWQWAGLRPGSPAGVPFIGPYPGIAGLFLNAGHFRNGVVMGPASARLLADLVAGRPPILDPEPYRLAGGPEDGGVDPV